MLLATISLLKRSRFNTEPLEGLNVSPALNLRTRNPPRDTAQPIHLSVRRMSHPSFREQTCSFIPSRGNSAARGRFDLEQPAGIFNFLSPKSPHTSADDVIMFYEESVVVGLGKFGL